MLHSTSSRGGWSEGIGPHRRKEKVRKLLLSHFATKVLIHGTQDEQQIHPLHFWEGPQDAKLKLCDAEGVIAIQVPQPPHRTQRVDVVSLQQTFVMVIL